MSVSTSVMSRFVAVFFFIAAAAGVFGVMTHSKLQAAEQRLSVLEYERTTLKDKLIASEKNAVEGTTAAKTCAIQMESFKSRAQSAEAALDGAKGKKSTPARPHAG